MEPASRVRFGPPDLRALGDAAGDGRGPHQAFGPDGDWFGFGILAARCLLPIEHLGNNSPTPQARYRQVLNKIEKSKGLLTDIEREFLLRLVAETPLERMTRHEDIAAGIEDIVSRLGRSSMPGEWDDLYVLMVDPKNTQVVEAVMAAGSARLSHSVPPRCSTRETPATSRG